MIFLRFLTKIMHIVAVMMDTMGYGASDVPMMATNLMTKANMTVRKIRWIIRFTKVPLYFLSFPRPHVGCTPIRRTMGAKMSIMAERKVTSILVKENTSTKMAPATDVNALWPPTTER